MIFDRVDANGSQVCSRDEIMAKLGKNVGQEFLDAFDGQSVFSANGNVTRIGFENRCRKLMEEDRKGFRAILKRCQDTMEVFGVAQSLFDKLDQDGSGTINSKEIVTQLGTHGEAFLKAFDGQNAFSANGNVTRREFSSRCRDLEAKDRQGFVELLKECSADRTKAANKTLSLKKVRAGIANEIFDAIDENKSGVLSKKEIQTALGSKLGQEFLETFDGQNVFSANGNVTRIGFTNRCDALDGTSEFALILKRCQDTMEVFGVAQSLFDKLDQDGSGTINSKEIVTQLGTHGEAFLKAFDGQNAFSANGNVTRREFSSRCRDLEAKDRQGFVELLKECSADRTKAANKTLSLKKVRAGIANEIFDAIDENKSGVLSKKEIQTALGSKLGQEFLETFDGQNVFSANGNVTRIGFTNRCDALDGTSEFSRMLQECRRVLGSKR